MHVAVTLHTHGGDAVGCVVVVQLTVAAQREVVGTATDVYCSIAADATTGLTCGLYGKAAARAFVTATLHDRAIRNVASCHPTCTRSRVGDGGSAQEYLIVGLDALTHGTAVNKRERATRQGDIAIALYGSSTIGVTFLCGNGAAAVGAGNIADAE